MYNETYDDYIRSILGYSSVNSYQNNYNQSYRNYSNYDNQAFNTNSEIENCYPEIYKIVYPMITNRCNNITSDLTKEEVEKMTDEIYLALESQNEKQVSTVTNDVRSKTSSSTKLRESISEKRETRQFNNGLRDLIKILLIRELLNRPGRPPVFPRPPMPPSRPRPPRPPMRPGPGRPPFMREFETNNAFDVFEN